MKNRPRSKSRNSAPKNAIPALGGYELLLCITGGIAAYKAAFVVSTLVQAGCGVTIAMTRNARRFVTPLTFQALSGRPVCFSLWGSDSAGEQKHLRLSEIADLILVAPATANIIGKLANGIADDLVSTLLVGADCPILLAPAMNSRMWNHPAMRRNMATLHKWGCTFVGPDTGWLACRTVGEGRMSEPNAIVDAVTSRLTSRKPRNSIC